MPVIAEFTLAAVDDSANDGDFIGLQASVACRGFSGQTAFTIARRDVSRFRADAANLATHEADTAELVGGWDDAAERLRLRITRAGLSDQFTVRVQIGTTGPREDQWNRVETAFVAPPAALAAFLSALSQSFDNQGSSAALRGDPDAIA